LIEGVLKSFTHFKLNLLFNVLTNNSDSVLVFYLESFYLLSLFYFYFYLFFYFLFLFSAEEGFSNPILKVFDGKKVGRFLALVVFIYLIFYFFLFLVLIGDFLG